MAWERMTPQARTRAISLLMRNPDYQTWVEGFPARNKAGLHSWKPQPGRTIFAAELPSPPAANCIRDDGYTPADASADLNIGYNDHRLRRYWHFEDLPFSDDGTPLEQPFAPNAESQISFFTQSLSDSAVSEDAKSLIGPRCFISVGDVHRPLQATARFSSASPHGDNEETRSSSAGPPRQNASPAAALLTSCTTLWDDAIGAARACARHAKRPTGSCNNF